MPTTDELRSEIEKKQAELPSQVRELEAKEAKLAEEREKAIREYFTYEWIDALYPEHNPSRYSGGECDDDDLNGAYRRNYDLKEYGCHGEIFQAFC